MTPPSRGQRAVTGVGSGGLGGILSEVGFFLTGSVFPFFSSSAPSPTLDPYSPCNKNCECQTDSFTPVCGADGITYLSACFAGCNSTVRRSPEGWAWASTRAPHLAVLRGDFFSASGLVEDAVSGIVGRPGHSGLLAKPTRFLKSVLEPLNIKIERQLDV